MYIVCMGTASVSQSVLEFGIIQRMLVTWQSLLELYSSVNRCLPVSPHLHHEGEQDRLSGGNCGPNILYIPAYTRIYKCILY